MNKMKSFLRIIGMLLTLCSCGCDKDNAILELKDIQNFKAAERRSGSELQITGLVFHSALAVEKMTTKPQGDDLVVELHLARAREGLSGSFDFVVAVPPNVVRVLFGKQQKEIWRSR